MPAAMDALPGYSPRLRGTRRRDMALRLMPIRSERVDSLTETLLRYATTLVYDDRRVEPKFKRPHLREQTAERRQERASRTKRKPEKPPAPIVIPSPAKAIKAAAAAVTRWSKCPYDICRPPGTYFQGRFISRRKEDYDY